MDWLFMKMVGGLWFLGDLAAERWPLYAMLFHGLAWIIPVLLYAWIARLVYLGFRLELGLIKPKEVKVYDVRPPVIMPDGSLMYHLCHPWGELAGGYCSKPKPKAKLELVEEPKSEPVETVNERPKIIKAGRVWEE